MSRTLFLWRRFLCAGRPTALCLPPQHRKGCTFYTPLRTPPCLFYSNRRVTNTNHDRVTTRHQQLIQEIKKHDRLYYQEDRPQISDAKYDDLRREVEVIEAEHPQLKSGDTDTVGAPPLKAMFHISRHSEPMLSLANGVNEKDFISFVERVRSFLSLSTDEVVDFVSEPKIDGLSVNLRYVNGQLDGLFFSFLFLLFLFLSFSFILFRFLT